MCKFLVLTGPSAVGKSTIVSRVLNNSRFHLSVSYTTRPPRPWETCGVDYCFVTKEQFEEKLSSGFFLEHTIFSKNYYGTPAHSEMKGKIIVFDVDLRGYYFFRQHYPSAYFCLVMADRETVKVRLENRMQIQHQTVHSAEASLRLRSFGDFAAVNDPRCFNKIIKNSGPVEESSERADELVRDVLRYYDSTSEATEEELQDI